MSFEAVKRLITRFFKPRKNATWHRHDFQMAAENALGYWQKRDCPGDGVYFRGVVRHCAGCGESRFRVPGLQEVEVT